MSSLVDGNGELPWPLPWQRALAIITHISGALSVFGSGWIIMEVLRDKKKRGAVYHRLLLCMSIYDLASSFWLFLSSWVLPAIPTATANVWYGAAGNQRSCTAQGFFIALGIATPIYNSSLSLYYLLQFKFNWSDCQFSLRVEPWVHVFATTVAVVLAVTQLPLQLYQPGVLPWCGTVHPPTCYLLSCEKGSGFNRTFFAVIYYCIVWLCTLFSSACIIMVYQAVRSVELRVKRYDFARSKVDECRDKEKLCKSRQVARLGALYMVSYVLTWTIPSISLILWKFDAEMTDRGHFILLVLHSILFPLQGWFNFLIYIRPRCVKYAKENPEWTSFRVIREVFQRPLTSPNAADDDYMLGVIDEEESNFISGYGLNSRDVSIRNKQVGNFDEENGTNNSSTQ